MSKPKNHYYEDVYDIVRLIPKGRVTTYGAIADFLALGSARMVGWALNQCAKSDGSKVPAHRVINRKGELSGRAHWNPPSRMQALLESEGITVKNHIVHDFDTLYWHPESLLK